MLSSSFVTRSLFVLVGLFLQPCSSCFDWYAADLRNQGDFARSPYEVFADGASGRVRSFKPLDLATMENTKVKGDRRFSIRGTSKNDDGSLGVQGPDGSGLFSLGSTFAIDSIDGLIEDTSEGYVLAGYPDGQREIRIGLRVSFEEGSTPVRGLYAMAYDFSQKDPCVGSMFYPNVSSLDVRLEQDEDSLHYLVRETPVSGNPAFETLAEQTREPATSFITGFGAFDLGRGGEFYVDDFWFIGPDLGGPPLERNFIGELQGVRLCLDEASSLLSGDPDIGDISLASGLVNDARSSFISMKFSLEDFIKNEPEAFDSTTQPKFALRAAKSGYRRLDKTYKLLEKMLESEKITSKRINSSLNGISFSSWRAMVAQSNFVGYKAKNPNQLGFTYHIDESRLPRFALPDEDG